ncbi:hypothetical protein [unidentified bacterial endosymbiont]|nr:hypothetical protein [unidentified bacterial endosymbiont]
MIFEYTKAEAEAIREECRSLFEDSPNMDKTRITASSAAKSSTG